MEILRAWEGGPLREFSKAPPPRGGKWTYYHTASNDPKREYTRSFVCDECSRSVVGLYYCKTGVPGQRKWLCGECRDAGIPKQEQPAHLKRKEVHR